MEKNKISRASCQKDLNNSAKNHVRGDVLMFVASVFAFCPILIPGIVLTVKGITSRNALLIACGCLFALFFIGVLYSGPGRWLLKSIRRTRIVQQGGFSIIKDTVLYNSMGEFVPGFRNPQNVTYFQILGRQILSDTYLALASPGDTYYFVVVHFEKPEPFFTYPASLYECPESDVDTRYTPPENCRKQEPRFRLWRGIRK